MPGVRAVRGEEKQIKVWDSIDMGMQVQFKNAELQAKIEQWVSDTGCPAEELVEDVMAG